MAIDYFLLRLCHWKNAVFIVLFFFSWTNDPLFSFTDYWHFPLSLTNEVFFLSFDNVKAKRSYCRCKSRSRRTGNAWRVWFSRRSTPRRSLRRLYRSSSRARPMTRSRSRPKRSRPSTPTGSATSVATSTALTSSRLCSSFGATTRACTTWASAFCATSAGRTRRNVCSLRPRASSPIRRSHRTRRRTFVAPTVTTSSSWRPKARPRTVSLPPRPPRRPRSRTSPSRCSAKSARWRSVLLTICPCTKRPATRRRSNVVTTFL